MDLFLLLKAVVMGLVEGLTEFLPISSTGHLIITGELLNFMSGARRAAFEIMIQLGAILAVCWVYRERLLHVVRTLHSASSKRFVVNVLIALIPCSVLGVLIIGVIKHYLFNPVAVASALLVGGVLMLWAEKRTHVIRVNAVDDMTWRDALKIGIAQSVALIPGTSRSGATIIGGLLFGLSRQAATEFSFFLAIPTMVLATLYEGYENRAGLSIADLDVFLTGFFSAFVFAMLAIRGLLHYIQRHDFSLFAWYRIAFGMLILVSSQLGWIHWYT